MDRLVRRPLVQQAHCSHCGSSCASTEASVPKYGTVAVICATPTPRENNHFETAFVAQFSAAKLFLTGEADVSRALVCHMQDRRRVLE